MPISHNDHRNIALLGQVLKRSHDPDRPVAAIIADASGTPVAEGANSPPEVLHFSPGESKAAIAADPTWKYFMMEHAERNAILHANARKISLVGTTMYGSLFPCADCARAIAASGIGRLVVPAPGLDPLRDKKWMDHYRFAQQILQLAGVQIDYFSPREAGPTASAAVSEGDLG